jgi:transposase
VTVFEPVYNALYKHQMTEDRWKVFKAVEGKIGHQWWLWVSKSDSVVFFQIVTSRGADVPGGYFFAIESDKIILVCDRYSSYKAMAKQLEFITLAFCWAHVRRDFEAFPALRYVDAQSANFTKYHCRLLEKMDQMRTEFEAFLEQPGKDTTVENIVLHEAKEKVLTSLKNHWKGLSVFVQHPLVAIRSRDVKITMDRVAYGVLN